MNTTNHGVGYAYNDFADTTASLAELLRLARVVKIGGYGPKPYRYAKPSDGDDAPPRPCNYPATLDRELAASLREAVDWDQANAVVVMKACQISQTGMASARRKASDFEIEWASLVFAGSRAISQLERIPGTCSSCNSDPCRCLA